MNPQEFTPGPFTLGKYSVVINTIACLWIAFISVLFVLPKQNPITFSNLNYAGIAISVVLIAVVISWMCGAGKEFWAAQQQKIACLQKTDHEQA